ncbi:hypothetical protein F5887DRAFT_924840 [Amanita rubescens]|nr:hypothetical protein F5887DRAFT_924840 [Amanita rubescens]
MTEASEIPSFTQIHQIHRLALKLTMMPSIPVPLSLSTYCQKLLHVIKLNRCVTSYDPAKQGLVAHDWHVVITPTAIKYDVPVLPDGKRVPPDELCLYRETHQYIGPGCLCPLLEPLTAHKEAAIYLAVNGLYPGEYIAECADDRCGYLVPLERIYPRRRVPQKAYPLRDVSTPYPPEVFSKNEVRADVEGPCLTEVFAPEVEPSTTTRLLKRTHAEAGLLDPPFPALKRRRTLTDWRRFEKVGSFHRPGLAEGEFLGLFVQCDVCKLIVMHRLFYEHTYEEGSYTIYACRDVQSLINCRGCSPAALGIRINALATAWEPDYSIQGCQGDSL